MKLKKFDNTLLISVWYYRNKINGKIYATRHVFSYIVSILKINPFDLDIIGYNNLYDGYRDVVK